MIGAEWLCGYVVLGPFLVFLNQTTVHIMRKGEVTVYKKTHPTLRLTG